MSDQKKALAKLVLIILGLLFAQLFSGNTIAMFATLLAVCLGAVYAISNISKIGSFINNWPKSAIYSTFVFYICKILSEKLINAKFGIDTNNISHASSIGGIILSVPISLMLISVYLFFPTPIKRHLKAQKDATKTQDKEKFPALKSCFTICIIAFTVTITPFVDTLIPYTLLADAVKASACGPIENNVLYLKKNSTSCYRIHVNLFEGIYVLTNIEGKF